jgi:uncharacterized protein (TIGR02594 family)
MIEPLWLSEARKHVGQREIPGLVDNPWIVSLWKTIKRGGIKSESVPWCAAFVGACLENVGLMSSRFESAASYMTWGRSISQPVVGCIVVFTRQGGGHVGFVVGQDVVGNLLVLGGNQGDAVSIAAFSRLRVTAYRWPDAVPLPTGSNELPLAVAQMSRSEA